MNFTSPTAAQGFSYKSQSNMKSTSLAFLERQKEDLIYKLSVASEGSSYMAIRDCRKRIDKVNAEIKKLQVKEKKLIRKA